MGVAMVTALVALFGGAWGLQRWAPFAEEIAVPAWPDNVHPLVDYVEDATDQHFVSPITIEFV